MASKCSRICSTDSEFLYSVNFKDVLQMLTKEIIAMPIAIFDAFGFPS